MPPGKASGSYSRHLNSALKLSFPVEVYLLKCPGRQKKNGARCEVSLPLLPLQDLLAKELEDNPAATTALQAANLPPNYHTHPVVAANADDPVWPLVLYLDGVPVTKRDGLLVMTMRNLATGHRWLFAAIKKSHLCKCGCRGWCSIWAGTVSQH